MQVEKSLWTAEARFIGGHVFVARRPNCEISVQEGRRRKVKKAGLEDPALRLNLGERHLSTRVVKFTGEMRRTDKEIVNAT